jgi:hypothetical protein
MRLSTVLTGKELPRNQQEGLEFADFCVQYKQYYLAATRFYADAFAGEPKLADDLNAWHRYNAARAAALAAAGKGEDARGIGIDEWAWLQQRAHDWLRAELEALAKLVKNGNSESQRVVQQRLGHWQKDAGLVAVRDIEWLAAMPEQDRERWQKLWADVNGGRNALASRSSGRESFESRQCSDP